MDTATSLGREWWLAVGLLLAPWLLTLCLGWPHHLGAGLITGLALVPGLALALHLLHQLHRHFGGNHLLGEEERCFATLGAANWITLLRGSGLVGLAGFFPLAVGQSAGLDGPLAWGPGLLYLGVSAADLLDGLVARRQGRETELGKRLDISTDAAGLLVASLLAVALGRLPAFYLLVGLAYYPFVIGLWFRRRQGLPVVALRPRPYARIMAGFQMGLVGVALLPVAARQLTTLAAIIFMTPLLAGFLRDWLVVSCRLPTDGDQQTPWDGWSAALWTRALPPLARLVLLGGAVASLSAASGGQRASAALCLLAGLGVMGRSVALALALLLGIEQNPAGATASAMLLFGAVSLVMLTGTGKLSLWSPEEAVLYRRQRP